MASEQLPPARGRLPNRVAFSLQPPQASPSEGVHVSLVVVVAVVAETFRGISQQPGLSSLLSTPVFLINTFEIFMKATSMK